MNRLYWRAAELGKLFENRSHHERCRGRDVDAIHPGYGFLAENAHFAEVCESCNIHFIGPPASAMRAMGDKNLARQFARRAGVPITPGSDGVVTEENDALKLRRRSATR